MKNYICEGERIQAVAGSGGVTSGSIVFIGNIRAVAITSAAETEVYTAMVEGVFEIAKETGAITIGQALYVTSTGTITATASGNQFVGFAYEAAASGDATGKLLLCGDCGPATGASVANVGGTAASDAITTVNALLVSLRAAGIIATA